jgi:hypothetical protein
MFGLRVPPTLAARICRPDCLGHVRSGGFATSERAGVEPARMPSARRLRPQPTKSVAGSCPASVVPLASVSALAAFGSFPCLSYHPCLPSAGSLLAIMARDGECVANTGLPWRHDDPPFEDQWNLVNGRIAGCSQKHRRCALIPACCQGSQSQPATRRPDMDSTKKVVEPPKSATPPVKAQPQPQHDATTASAEQPKSKT